MALKVNLYRNNNQKSKNYGQVYGRCINAKPIDEGGLAQHMAEHNTPYSPGIIKGILTDAVRCIRELLLMGQPVKLTNLAIFKASVISNGADTAEAYDLSTNVKAVKLCAQATGVVRRAELTRDGLLEYTTLANAVRAGQAELPTGKGEGSEDGGGSSTEPDVRP